MNDLNVVHIFGKPKSGKTSYAAQVARELLDRNPESQIVVVTEPHRPELVPYVWEKRFEDAPELLRQLLFVFIEFDMRKPLPSQFIEDLKRRDSALVIIDGNWGSPWRKVEVVGDGHVLHHAEVQEPT